MAVGTTGSPRNYPANRRDSYDQSGSNFAGNRFNNAGYSESGTHSLPYSFQNSYSDATVYQVYEGNLFSPPSCIDVHF